MPNLQENPRLSGRPSRLSARCGPIFNPTAMFCDWGWKHSLQKDIEAESCESLKSAWSNLTRAEVCVLREAFAGRTDHAPRTTHHHNPLDAPPILPYISSRIY